MKNSGKSAALTTVLAIALIAMIGMNVYQVTKPEKEAPTKDIFGEQVRAYLLENPVVIREAIEALTLREQAEAEARKKEALVSRMGEIENDGYSFVAGNPNGDVTIVEFFDYRCPYCKRSFPDLMKTVADDGNIRLVKKEFPILGEQSILASRAAIAAIKQGKYIELHSAMMQAQGSLTMDRVMSYAVEVGLDTDQLAKDMQSEEITAGLRQTYDLAKALDINGTPAFIIGGELAPGAIPAEVMKKLVAEARTRKAEGKTATN